MKYTIHIPQVATKIHKTFLLVRWLPPPTGKIKLNLDGTLRGNLDLAEMWESE